MCPELKGRIDTVSISLNAVTAREYVALCHPVQGESAYQAMLDFARESEQYAPHVILTIVDKDKSPEEIPDLQRYRPKAGGKAAHPQLHRLLTFRSGPQPARPSSSRASRSLSAEKQKRPAPSYTSMCSRTQTSSYSMLPFPFPVLLMHSDTGVSHKNWTAGLCWKHKTA
ncbi:MAG: hypothetical protein V8S34_01975 [Lawsonibacter sp.]